MVNGFLLSPRDGEAQAAPHHALEVIEFVLEKAKLLLGGRRNGRAVDALPEGSYLEGLGLEFRLAGVSD